MAHWSKLLSVVLVAGSMTFAQFDDSDEDFTPEETSTEASAESKDSFESYGNSEEEESVGEAKATGDEWDGFKYEEMGLSQWEFQKAREEGISRDKLTRLVELGVRPSEYIQRPWERLGVSEEAWLSQRSEGLEDADIDRSYRNKSGHQGLAYASLLVPSLYQWKMDDNTTAIWIDALWLAGVGATVYMATSGEENWFYFLIPVVGAHIWSFADAFFSTQWDSNPDANRFSYGIIPTPTRTEAGLGVTGYFNVKF
ncbi:MAG: hypothetical protein HUK21_06930 [Fibrobacteraceae bacterium]|nr:hypothetical protein [Fibrobacteraceae bacterium]